jgi:hypothetical protein
MQEIHLRNSTNVALVDDEDYALVAGLDWYENRKPRSQTLYAAASVRTADGGSRTIMMHRLVMRMRDDDPRLIDHWDCNGLNNTPENLRVATYQQNAANVPLRRDSTSNYKGVSPHRRSGQWRARTGAEGKIALGYYATRHEAAFAYNLGAAALYGRFARLNTIDPADLPTPKRQAEIERQVNKLLAPHMASLAMQAS